MAHSERDTAEKINALSERYRDGEFSEAIMRASLKYKMPADEADILIRQINQQRGERHGSK